MMYKLLSISGIFRYSNRRYPVINFSNVRSLITDSNTDKLITNDLSDLLHNVFRLSSQSQRVILIHPYIKWGKNKTRKTTISLQMEEAIALVDSLSGWTVVESETVPLLTFCRSSFFGKGKLEELKQFIRSKSDVTALFINVKMLQAVQHRFLEDEFCLPVYDRYLMVMNIFRQHAVSPEAKLQISLAELPYLRSKVQLAASLPGLNVGNKVSAIGGLGISPEAFHETRKMHLQRYENKLKESLEKLRNRRESARERRQINDFPIVAVVGYTNSGKTSLIKALTGSKKLNPKNQLFATLDVTFHEGLLPSNLKVLYVDTLGFITDIPTDLIEPFRVTLQDAMVADVLVHVEDVSHPDVVAQRAEVNKTLRALDIAKDLLDNMITVSNKIDLLDSEQCDIDVDGGTSFKVSCKKLIGLQALKEKLEDLIVKNTGRRKLIMRVKGGCSEMKWLYEQTAVINVTVDPKDVNYSLMTVFITESCLNVFKRNFIGPKSKI